MVKSFHGVLSFLFIVAFVTLGALASSRYSTAYGIAYTAITAAAVGAIILSYCAKCPGKHKCVHIVPGLIARHIRRKAAPYTPAEYSITALAFLLLVVVPLPALMQSMPYLIAFTALATAAVMELLTFVCAGCYNVNCPMKRIAHTEAKK